MKRIKNYLLKVQEEFKGVSKGAIVTVLIVESYLCAFLIAAMLITSISLTAANNLTDNVLEAKRSVEEQLYDTQVEAEHYKQLYDKAKQEIIKLNK
jgi:hypothetical protein